MVYNSTSRGLNELLWAPYSTISTMPTQIRSIQHSTNMGNIDVGEMFLNFVVQKSLIKSCRVDVPHIPHEDPKLVYWKPQI